MVTHCPERPHHNIALVGLLRLTEALISISWVKPGGEEEHPFTCDGWQCDETNHNRGAGWLLTIYTQNTTVLFGLFNRHRDWGFWVNEMPGGCIFRIARFLMRWIQRWLSVAVVDSWIRIGIGAMICE